jgi:hypothetical protein
MATVNDPSQPLPVPNSEQEYVNGVADDGTPLEIISQHLTPPWGETEKRPPIGPHAVSSPQHLEFDQKALEAERAHIARVRKSVALMEGTVDLGDLARQILAVDAQIELETKRRHLERLKNTPVDQDVPPVGEVAVPAAPAGPDDASGIAVSAMRGARVPRSPAREAREGRASPGRHEPEARGTHCRDGNATRAPRGPREPRVPNIKFSPALLLTLALRAAKDLPGLSEKLRDLEAKLLPAEAELKRKQEFYLDRAVSIVTDTLNSMDEKFGKLGFGHWMPFRYIDQWLMFTGILNRVLAAHGLMPSGNAAVYRKLLDDTDPISPACADAGPPKSYGLGYRVREFRTMKDMLARIAEVRAGRGPPL